MENERGNDEDHEVGMMAIEGQNAGAGGEGGVGGDESGGRVVDEVDVMDVVDVIDVVDVVDVVDVEDDTVESALPTSTLPPPLPHSTTLHPPPPHSTTPHPPPLDGGNGMLDAAMEKVTADAKRKQPEGDEAYARLEECATVDLVSSLFAEEDAVSALEAEIEKLTAQKKIPLAAGKDKVEFLKSSFDEIDWESFEVPKHSVPIRADVRLFDWEALGSAVQFDVILMDPPWQLATSAPTRGVALGYSQLRDDDIARIPVPKLQENGLLFIWVINARYSFAFQLFKEWGYEYVDDVVWVKRTVNRKMAKGHGYYLQHAKETCLVGKKGKNPPNFQGGVVSDVIWSERRGQSQKPEELYELIEKLVPHGRYLEIFGRKNNLRDYWVTIGNEI